MDYLNIHPTPIPVSCQRNVMPFVAINNSIYPILSSTIILERTQPIKFKLNNYSELQFFDLSPYSNCFALLKIGLIDSSSLITKFKIYL